MNSDAKTSFLYDLKVYNDCTGEMLGYVTAIDNENVEMLLDEAIDLEKETFFAIENILEMEPGHTAIFAAICDECDSAAAAHKHHAKLRFTQISNEVAALQEVLH
ncbi:MAG: hypothetical protein MI867_15540 [Pseudomonadales bacterium]|nr:hypothetical protein [Pseudomonadales bacterium]